MRRWQWLARLRRGYGRKLHRIHAWNGAIVALLAATGLLLVFGFWRGVLGEGRVWIKWLHIGVGIAAIVPVLYYLLLAGRHWRQLKGRPWQRVNVLAVLVLLLGWFGSGVLLWQHRAVGPAVSNAALALHDLLTWIGLPVIIYHSLTRTKWLKEQAHRRIVKREPLPADAAPREALHPAAMAEPLYTRAAFLRMAIGGVLAVLTVPSFLRWLGSGGASFGLTGGQALDRLVEANANRLVPPPVPLPASAPPIGGGNSGGYRIYTVTDIPSFTNDNWSFAIDGLVERPVTYTWPDFVALKRTVQVSDFHCITGWSVYDNTWEGIPLKVLLDAHGVLPAAKHVKFYSGDGVYTDALTLEQARMDDVMAAVLLDGKPIPSDLGGPVRLIVPKMYAYKSVKWLNRIELIDGEHIGYWERRGYPHDAWV